MRLAAIAGILSLLSLFLIFHPSYAAEKDRAYYEKTGDVIWDIRTDEKVIALTFDDGPSSTFTPQILDILAEYDAKATFFVIGEQAAKYPELIRREYKEGHEIANHTYTHLQSHLASNDSLIKELKQTDEIILKLTGTIPIFYRPVGGYYNEKIIETAVQHGFRVVLWSWHQDTQDWKSPGVSKIVTKVLSGARPGDVVLFHDAGGDRTQTIEALKEILPTLKKEGYKFVTVSELMNRTGFEVFH